MRFCSAISCRVRRVRTMRGAGPVSPSRGASSAMDCVGPSAPLPDAMRARSRTSAIFSATRRRTAGSCSSLRPIARSMRSACASFIPVSRPDSPTLRSTPRSARSSRANSPGAASTSARTFERSMRPPSAAACRPKASNIASATLLAPSRDSSSGVSFPPAACAS